jgi:hypothetical protein
VLLKAGEGLSSATAFTIDRVCPRCGGPLEALGARARGRLVIRWIYCPRRRLCGYSLRAVTTGHRRAPSKFRPVQLKLLLQAPATP